MEPTTDSDKTIVNPMEFITSGTEHFVFGLYGMYGGAAVATAGIAGIILSNLPILAPTVAFGGAAACIHANLVNNENDDKRSYIDRTATITVIGMLAITLSNFLPESNLINIFLFMGGTSISALSAFFILFGFIEITGGTLSGLASFLGGASSNRQS